MYLLLRAHGNFSKIYHILIFKESLKRYKKIKTTPRTLSDHQGLKLDYQQPQKLHKAYQVMETEQLTIE